MRQRRALQQSGAGAGAGAGAGSGFRGRHWGARRKGRGRGRGKGRGSAGVGGTSGGFHAEEPKRDNQRRTAPFLGAHRCSVRRGVNAGTVQGMICDTGRGERGGPGGAVRVREGGARWG